MRKWIAVMALGLGTAAPTFGHGSLYVIGSSAAGSGQLLLEADLEDKIAVSESITLGDVTLYTGLIPSFAWAPEPPLFALPNGTPINFEITAVESGASVKFEGRTIDAPGESALIGMSTDVAEAHEHAQWQLVLPQGVTGDYALSFKLTNPTHAFDDSPIYSVTITNVIEPVCDGDCNEDNAVTQDELLTLVNVALGAAEEATCEAGDTNGDEDIDISEMIAAVNAATNACGTSHTPP